MGAVSSKPDDGAALYVRDQARLSIASLTITNSRQRVVLHISPNDVPGTRLFAKRDTGDDGVIDFVQDPDPPLHATSPSFILRLNNDQELNFHFMFVVRQPVGTAITTNSSADTIVNGLTFIQASNSRELDNLVTREFHADPNLHRNANVQLIGDASTKGSPAIEFNWSWTWKPPKLTEDRGGGWRNSCGVGISAGIILSSKRPLIVLQFVEYDQRAHRLTTLATFAFWVQNTQRVVNSPQPPCGFDMIKPPRLRVPSSQSIESRFSDNEMQNGCREPPSPTEALTEEDLALTHTITYSSTKVDVSCQRPGEDMSAVEDGPLFRATMKALEQKTGNMRARMKKVLKKAEAAQAAQVECNGAVTGFMEALREASSSNANAFQPALEHYFDKIAREILSYERQNTVNLQKLIIDPFSKLYNIDIKQAESKKKDFEDESRDYYAYLGRYLGQRSDSLKEKKRIESDSKYQTKRRNFELRRFDYSSFMQDLHGGRKEQEVLSQLTKFADTQAKSYLSTAKKIEDLIPQLEALNHEVREADKEFQFQRTEREEKRRILEKSTKTYVEPDSIVTPAALPVTASNTTSASISDSDLNRADSTTSTLKNGSSSVLAGNSPNMASLAPPSSNNPLNGSPGGHSPTGLSRSSPNQNRFKGIRDLGEKDYSNMAGSEKDSGQHRKEGLLWALSRPGSHVDPKGLNKQAWHKGRFWIVLDQGKLSEYSNWKLRLDLHMEPIDLLMASVREARNADRRFCFEVITPQYKRVYQATSEEDMNSWISAINNALQSAVEGRGQRQNFDTSSIKGSPSRRDIGSVLTGKSSSYAGHNNYNSSHHSKHSSSAAANNVYRRITVGARPTYVRTNSNSFEENPSKLLQIVRDTDQGNCWCADCGSGIKTEWVSINLGIVLCIECSGIHRSLGTHISKVRSLTLDITSFSTDIVEILLSIGNRVSNMVWEARLDSTSPIPKPIPQSTRDQRLKFITAKYVDRAWVTPISASLSHYSTPEETLLASTKKNDIQGVLYALALKANPNTTDRSRNTHSVFLALAAASPASPAFASSPSLTPGGRSPPAPATAVSFPVAELLVQNGADIPATLPAFPLSQAAKLYVEQKTAASSHTGVGLGDVLGALPTIKAGDGSSPAEQQKERDSRLQKRGSANGRLAKAPNPDR
ncbi:MAG: hypothetical protein M1835_006072 [Candelina submexicana]|nr:MAG: hypothetical protein M1835_006072 [Candelina submexicana]